MTAPRLFAFSGLPPPPLSGHPPPTPPRPVAVLYYLLLSSALGWRLCQCTPLSCPPSLQLLPHKSFPFCLLIGMSLASGALSQMPGAAGAASGGWAQGRSPFSPSICLWQHPSSASAPLQKGLSLFRNLPFPFMWWLGVARDWSLADLALRAEIVGTRLGACLCLM